MADVFSILWTIVSFILGIFWGLIWFVLRDLLSTLLWVCIAVWLGFVLRYRSFSLGSLALLRYARYGLAVVWRWVRGRPALGAALPREPVSRTEKGRRQRIPLGYASVSEQMNVLIIMLFILMANV